MRGWKCLNHDPIQHRDGKPPWCESCGLTFDYLTPVARFDKENKVADNTGIPFSTYDEGVNYPNLAREIVFRYIMNNRSNVDLAQLGFSKNDVYIVWFAKTLKNWKALVSSRIPDGRYFEVTYNGDTDFAYLDVYTKQENIEVSFEDIEMLADGVPFTKVRIPRGFEPTDDPI